MEQVRQLYFNPDLWQQVWDSVQATYLNPEMWQRAIQVTAKTYSAENLKRLADSVRLSYDTEVLGAFGESMAADSVVQAAQGLADELAEAERYGAKPA